MRKLLMLLGAGMVALGAAAQVTVELPKNWKGKEIGESHVLIKELVSARNESELNLQSQSVSVKKHKAEFALDAAGPSRYRLNVGDTNVVDFYATPGEKINIKVMSEVPFEYKLTGSVLMSDKESLDTQLERLSQRYQEVITALRSGTGGSEAELDSLANEFEKVNLDFISANPESPAVAYAVSNLSGENFLKAFDNMTDAAKESALYPVVAAMYAPQKERVEAERATNAMISGHVDAPDFTLPDLAGNQVSLSSFRGKYVVVDFWGSWCIWCIKGFPHLKEAYEQYAPNLEVVGVDCGDTDAAWRTAVDKYKLPWVNLYNGDEEKAQAILAKYNVQGFPTKVLVNPEGKIVTIAVGEDPAFYDVLAKELGK